jgi:hypothetical protein
MGGKWRGVVAALAIVPGVLIAMAVVAPVASADVGTVTAQNQGPWAVSSNGRTLPSGTLQVGSSDTDPNPSVVCCTAALAAAPSHGSAVVNADGSFTYTPSTGFAGKDSFTYTLTDSDGNVSGPAMVNMTVLYKCNSNSWGSFSGRPAVDSQDPQGFYIGQKSGTFTLFTAHPGTSNVVFTGTLTLNPMVNGVRFSNVTVLKGEDNSNDRDTVTLIGEQTLKFQFDTYRSVDGVQFHPSCASSMNFDLRINGVEASSTEIFLGSSEHHVKAIPFTMTR